METGPVDTAFRDRRRSEVGLPPLQNLLLLHAIEFQEDYSDGTIAYIRST